MERESNASEPAGRSTDRAAVCYFETHRDEWLCFETGVSSAEQFVALFDGDAYMVCDATAAGGR